MADLDWVTPQFIADLIDYPVLALSKNGDILFFNRHTGNVFGNLAVNSLIDDFVNNEELSVIRHNLTIALYHQNNFDFYWVFRRRFYSVSAHAEKDTVFLCFRDISEVRAQSDLLISCNRRFSNIEQIMHSGYWELNLKHKVFYWSDGMYQLFGINDKNKKYHYNLLRQYIHPDDIEIYRRSLRELLKSGHAVSGEIRIINSDGKIRLCRFAALKINIDGEENACGILQDITDYCNQSNYMSVVELSHSVKQHIQAIKLFNDSQKGGSNQNIEQQIEIITDKLNNQVSAYLVSGIISESIDVKKMLEDICLSFSGIAEAKKLRLLCHADTAFFQGNHQLLQQILHNLLDNAFKYAKSKVVLGNSRNSIWVIDDGCGISSEEQSRIFSRFCHQADSQSWGVGLSMVCNFAGRMGIDISLKSRLGRYSIFRLKLASNEGLPN